MYAFIIPHHALFVNSIAEIKRGEKYGIACATKDSYNAEDFGKTEKEAQKQENKGEKLMYNPAAIFDYYRRLTIGAICAFFVGGSAYYALEMLWRGHSHITMWFCGAVCLLGIYFIEWCRRDGHILKRALYSALFITAVEFAFGCIFNLWLKLNVWDYSDLPLNLFGQICLPFTCIWYLLSFPAAGVCKLIRGAAGIHVRS